MTQREKFFRARRLLDSKGEDTRTVLESLLRFVAGSDVEMALVNLEDLWLAEQPQNVPGVPDRSWRHRLRLSLQDMQSDETVMQSLHAVDEARREKNGDQK